MHLPVSKSSRSTEGYDNAMELSLQALEFKKYSYQLYYTLYSWNIKSSSSFFELMIENEEPDLRCTACFSSTQQPCLMPTSRSETYCHFSLNGDRRREIPLRSVSDCLPGFSTCSYIALLPLSRDCLAPPGANGGRKNTNLAISMDVHDFSF